MSPLLKALSATAAVVAVALVPGVSGAATTDAVCKPSTGYSWAFNSLKQSPCLIAAYAEAQCNDGDWNVPALKDGYYYSGPSSPEDANPCRCSIPVWSLITACEACQNGTYWATWQQWTTNCTAAGTYPTFPLDVPQGTRIPAWAYLPVPNDGIWDPVLAKAATGPESSATHIISTVTSVSATFSSSASLTSATGAGGPDSSTQAGAGSSTIIRTGSATGVSTGSGGVIISTVTGPPTSTSSSSSGGGGSSNAGPIAGGVVGGIVALSALAGLFWFLRKRRNSAAPAPTAAGDYPQQHYPQQPMGQVPPGSPSATASYAPYTPSNESRPLTYYNPNDPTTFPQPNTFPQPVGSPAHTEHSGVPPSQQSAFYQSAANPFQTPLATPAAPSGYQPSLTPNRGYQGAPEI